MTPANPETARRVGIWTVAILLIGGAIWWLAQLDSTVVPPPAGPVGAIAAHDHVLGSGPVSLIEYGDFQCPACKSYHPVVKDFLNANQDKVTFAYRHFPLKTIHQNAEAASWASEAAGKQGKFWEMHDRLFDGQESWSQDRNAQLVFETYAADLGLNVEQFKQDMSSNDVRSKVFDDSVSGEVAGVRGTPTFFLNGMRMESASYDDFRNQILAAIPQE